MGGRKVMKLYISILIFGISNALGLPEEFGDGLDVRNVCPNIKILTTDLDVNKFYNGKPWYEIEKNQIQAETPTDCAKMRITVVTGTDSMEANMEFEYPNGYYRTFPGHVKYDAEIPYVTVTFPSDSTESLFYVLQTDYYTYAVAYSCSSDFENNKQDRIWILSRAPQSNDYASSIESAIEEQSDVFQQKISKQEGCESQEIEETNVPTTTESNDEVPNSTTCPNITVMTDLDVNKFYNGKLWYEIEKNQIQAETPTDCAKMLITVVTGTADPMEATMNFDYPNGDYRTFPGHVKYDAEIPYVTAKFPSDSTESLFYVLQTDYQNYALAYSCSSDSENNKQDRIWILSRAPQSNDSASSIEKAIEEQSDVFKQKLSKQEGCEGQGIISQAVQPKSCRNLKNKHSLNLEMFPQEWFEQLRSVNDWENDTICANVTFQYDKIKSTFSMASQASGQVINYITFIVNTSDEEVIFGSSSNVTFYITDTDYDNYAVIYSCSQTSASEISERLWLLGRYEEIDSNQIEEVNNTFGDSLELSIKCEVPEAPPTTTTIKSTNVPTTTESNDEVPNSTTERESNSTKPEDRPPAYTYPGYDYKFYYLFQLGTNNKTAN